MNSLLRTAVGVSALSQVAMAIEGRGAADEARLGYYVHSDSSTTFQRFGYVVAATEHTLVVGTNTYDSSAAVYVFSRDKPTAVAVEAEATDDGNNEGSSYSGSDASADVVALGKPPIVLPGKPSVRRTRAHRHRHRHRKLDADDGSDNLATDPNGETEKEGEEEEEDALWAEVAKLVPAGPTEFTGFGSALAMMETSSVDDRTSAETNTLSVMVGAPAGGPKEDGQVYIYSRKRTNEHNTTSDYDWSDWSWDQMITGSDRDAGDQYGCAVALTADVALVGAKNRGVDGDQSGGVYVYTRDNIKHVWSHEQILEPPGVGTGSADHAKFGSCVAAIAVDTNILMNEGRDDENTNDQGESRSENEGSAAVSNAIAVAMHGPSGLNKRTTVVAVGAPGDSSAYIEQGSVSLYLVETLNPTGPKPITDLSFLHTLVPSSTDATTGTTSSYVHFGSAVALSLSDNGVVQAAVAATESDHSGSVYLFLQLYSPASGVISSTSTRLLPIPSPSTFNVEFGTSLAFKHNVVVVGSPGDSYGDQSPHTGAVYVYYIVDNTQVTLHTKISLETGSATTQKQKSVDFIPQSHASYGQSVVISGSDLYVGVPTGDLSGMIDMETASASDAEGEASYAGFVTHEANFLSYLPITSATITTTTTGGSTITEAVILTAMILLVPGVLLGSFIAYRQYSVSNNKHVAIPLEDIEEGGIGIRGMNAPLDDDNNSSGGGSCENEVVLAVTSHFSNSNGIINGSHGSVNSDGNTRVALSRHETTDALEAETVGSDCTESENEYEGNNNGTSATTVTTNPLQRDNLVLRI